MHREKLKEENRNTPESKSIDRRSLLEWLGKGTVLALGGATLYACTHNDDLLGDSQTSDSAPGNDLSESENHSSPSDFSDGDGSTNNDTQSEGPFAFEPTESTEGIYENWGIRTVDVQELENILKTWELRVDGLVDSPKTFSFAEMVSLNRTDINVDFHCVEGWSVYDVPWNGVHLKTIFEQVKPTENATHVTFHTMRGVYNESLPLEIAKEPKTLLAYGISESTLPLSHGFPVRLVVPRLYAYKSAKYVHRIELTDQPVEGFWVKAGYPYDGEVAEHRLRPGKY